MKLLYLSTWDFANETSDGVCKKIKSQIKVFENKGYQVDFIYLNNHDVIFREGDNERIIAKVGNIKKTPAYLKMYRFIKDKSYDWVYNRYGMMDTFYYRVLKRLHFNGAKIIIEIPTYPYVKELPKSCLYKVMICWDELYLRRLRKYVNRIATYSDDDSIFGITTIKTVNGIDFSQICLKKVKKSNGYLDLIGVACVSPWHGFDRLITGLHEYYCDLESAENVRFHIVGEGKCIPEYKRLVEEYHLEQSVFFYGNKCGKELDELYDNSDIAVSSLGLHRIGILTHASVLKSREYGAKGLPMISSVEIDIFPPNEYQYIFYFPEDDTPIDISKIIEFNKKIHKNEEDVRRIIRDYSFKMCDQSVAFESILAYMKEVEDEKNCSCRRK